MESELDPVVHPALPTEPRSRITPVILAVMGLMLGAGFVAFQALKPKAPDAPPEIAGDALLVRGREVFLDRCASCHGQEGKGDGPTAAHIVGPPVGNLSDATWKHGDAPENVLGVIRRGVSDAQMPGWGGLISDGDVRAVAGWVYHLAGRPVPDPIRAGAGGG